MAIGLHLRPAAWGVATTAWGTLGAILVGRLSLGPTSRLERNRTWVVVVSQMQAIGVCLAGTGFAFSGDIGLAMEWRVFVAGLGGVGVAVSVARLSRVAWAGLARARLSEQAWRAPEEGWGWLVGKAFRITFHTRAAWTCANLSALGFLGALGFFGYLPFPGAYRCFGLFGLSGFFGLIGVAHLLEAAARRRLGGMEAVPRPVGLRAISLFFGSFVAAVLALAVWGMAWHGKVEWTGTLVFGFVFAAATVGVRIRNQKRAAAVPAAAVVGAARASLGWGERSRLSYGVFFALYAGMLALLAASVDRLPEKVASHFGFNGLADGWMSRRSYLLVGSYSIKNNSLSPEIPSGSCVLAWKPARTLRPGDLVVYRHEGRFMGGRVERSDAAGLVVNRNGVSGFPVAREAVCGRIVSVLWRGSAAEREKP